jgi:hypothetical protein
MTICPVALAVGCRKCPIFKICPAKSLIGDQPSSPAEPPAPASKRKTGKAKRK